MAFRRNRNFASVQIYNQKRVVRVYLNLDPDDVKINPSMMRDVRQKGHLGTGDLEVTIRSKKDIDALDDYFFRRAMQPHRAMNDSEARKDQSLLQARQGKPACSPRSRLLLAMGARRRHRGKQALLVSLSLSILGWWQPYGIDQK
ncbi:hypothetical protein [Ruegeria marina]|uniref:hypothetical protein n=1 Tax=Ruegeria marina TaxID=639004 RepID=UPI003CCBCE50